jgi:replicative DNA helicase
MLTESYLNSCFELIFAQKKLELDQSVYHDLLNFLNAAVPNPKDPDIPLSVRSKFELLKLICEKISSGDSMAEIHAALMLSEKHHKHRDFVEFNMSQKMEEQEKENRIDTIRKLLAFTQMSPKLKDIRKVAEKAIEGTFDTVEGLMTEWTDVVKSAYADVSEHELKSRSGLVSSINTREDNYDKIIDEIRNKYSKKNVMPSGITDLDTDFLGGGFQPSRLYMFPGTSGVGKSLLLLNMAIRGALCPYPELGPFFLPETPYLDLPPERVFLYITMENYPYETWIRLFSSLLDQTKEEVLQMIFGNSVAPVEIQKLIKGPMAKRHSSIQIEYFAPNNITPVTIAGLINKYNSNPEKRVVKAVYIDYLDLLKPDVSKDMWRLDLGEIASGLKSISARYEVPIITATQLNREAYKRNKKNELAGAEMIAESIQKLFIADFTAVMIRDNNDDASIGSAGTDDMPKKILLKVDKNRDGKTGQTHVYFDYPRSKLLTKDEFNEQYSKVLAV